MKIIYNSIICRLLLSAWRRERLCTSCAGLLQIRMFKDLVRFPESIIALCSSFMPPCKKRLRYSSTMCVAVGFSYLQTRSGNDFNRRLWNVSAVLPWLMRSLTVQQTVPYWYIFFRFEFPSTRFDIRTESISCPIQFECFRVTTLVFQTEPDVA